MAGILRHIIQLPRHIADRIAAGEVIDRPVSIVKELVENSIDAASSSIVVEIRKGGKSYIRVTDNGSGISSSDTETAFQRHATSKIREVSDLDSIETLGFRGEALASISAVSRTELITKTEEERAGSYVLMEGGNVADRSDKGCPVGTTIIVRDLFYNTPARLKFLKSDNTEASLVIDLVSKIALAYPEIRVRMINNNNTLFTTPGRGDRLSAIATIYDPHLAKNLIRVYAVSDDNGLQLEGYISSPDNNRKNRKSQIFFVNGRYVKNRVLEECVSEAYQFRMFEGRYPVAFLFLKVDPAFTDVNVHPNKKEIRFDNDDLIRDFVTETLKQALMEPDAVPEIHFTKDKKHVPQMEQEKQGPPDGNGGGAGRPGPAQMDIRAMLKAKRAEEEEAAYRTGEEELSGKKTEENGNGSFSRDSLPSGSSAHSGSEGQNSAAVSGKAFAEEQPAGDRPGSADGKSGPAPMENYFNEEEDRPSHIPFDVSAIRPVGIIFNEYILGSDEDTFYMIDQHAAHERIFYERLTSSFYRQQKGSQLLVVPITVKTTFAAGSLAEQWMDFLIRIGFSVEEFGQRTYIVREIPYYMDLEEAESFLNDFTEEASLSGSFADSRQRARIVTRSCKSAVKANDRLSDAEVAALLRDLAACRNPFSCPHGRPTIIRMKHSEIDRLFRR